MLLYMNLSYSFFLLFIPHRCDDHYFGRERTTAGIFQRFWFKQNNYNVCFPANVAQILDEMGVPYSKEIATIQWDVKECI